MIVLGGKPLCVLAFGCGLLLAGCRTKGPDVRQRGSTAILEGARWQPPPCQCSYDWPRSGTKCDPLWKRFPAPRGYRHASLAPDSFGCWLRGLPLRPRGAPIVLYDGTTPDFQSNHAAVVDMDTGRRNLQQCADAILRLRAEYLFSRGLDRQIQFSATNGQPLPYARWKRGQRPVYVRGRIRWRSTSRPGRSWQSFRHYLDVLFSFAGTLSLLQELQPIRLEEVQPGDVLIEGGSPGHAVVVVDVCQGPRKGDKLMLLAQSFMPAQSVHVLRNTASPRLSPWYAVSQQTEVRTPLWVFGPEDLRRFR